jgi:preprotein translocase subunit SecA
MIEYEFLVNTRESFWQMKFIFDWPQIYPIDTNQAKLFSDTYRYYSDKSVNEKFSNYLNLWVIPDRIQDEIDTYNEEKIRSKPDHYDDWDPTPPIVNTEPRIGRNDPCLCGSGKKYKKCCMDK